MNRRQLLQAGAAAGLALAAPDRARSAAPSVLKFIPQADVAVLDPIWTTAKITQYHAYMVFDTLFGMDGHYRMSPQMLESVAAEDDGKRWTLVLRSRLKWHDGEPVLARDCVASILRWGRRDNFGQSLLAATDRLSAPDDNTIEFRLKKPFPMLPNALGSTSGNLPVMMPERLAKTDPYAQVAEMIGSGPYRFKADERVPGSLLVYERFAGYRPRAAGAPDWTAGPKVAHFERVEWHVVPDQTAAAGALQSGEVDWWENPSQDIVPLLKAAAGIKVAVHNPNGVIGAMRFNHLHPPFDNPAIRRAVLLAIDQADFMAAAVGTEAEMSRAGVGFFCPQSPMASDLGMQALAGKRDPGRAKQLIEAAGYKGENVVLLAATDFPVLKAFADVGADALRRCGFNVNYQAMDWGTVVQRRAKKDAPQNGGWSVFSTSWPGLDQFDPASNVMLRCNGAEAWPGWPNSPRIEALRGQWLETADIPGQKRICAEIQKQAFEDVPYVPLGQYFQPMAYRTNLAGLLNGFPIFWNVRRT